MTKELILSLLKEESQSVTDSAGNTFMAIEELDFEDIADAIVKNLPIHDVSNINEEETEFCPVCNSANIVCEGGEFNEWDCENCGVHFAEPNVK